MGVVCTIIDTADEMEIVEEEVVSEGTEEINTPDFDSFEQTFSRMMTWDKAYDSLSPRHKYWLNSVNAASNL